MFKKFKVGFTLVCVAAVSTTNLDTSAATITTRLKTFSENVPSEATKDAYKTKNHVSTAVGTTSLPVGSNSREAELICRQTDPNAQITSNITFSGGTNPCLSPNRDETPLEDARQPVWRQDTSTTPPSTATKNAAITYVSPTGNDSNDGRTWGEAKATIYAAIAALPNGSVSNRIAGSGIVYVADGSRANPTINAGIWLMGDGDPNYASPPAGWLKLSGPVKIMGVNCQHAYSNQTLPVCSVVAGSGSDTNHPAIWLSSFGKALRFENLGFQYPGVGMKIGINSKGVRTGAKQNVVNVSFENVDVALNQIVGNGPGVDIGDNSFNIWFRKCGIGGNYTGTVVVAAMGSSGLVRASNLVTVMTRTPHGFRSGDNVGITDATDPSFNGSFRNITVTGPNKFTYAQTGPNTTSGDGIAVNDKAFALRVEPTAGGIGSGLIYFNDAVINGSAIRHWTGVDGGSMYINNVYTEGDYSHPISPTLWIGGTASAGVHFEINQTQIADQLGGYSAIIAQNDGASGADTVLVTGSGNQGEIVRGPATVIAFRSTNPNVQPFKAGQNGIVGGHLWAHTDVARESPQTVRFANISPTANTSWTNPFGGTISSNVGDRDGGTNAATLSSSRGIVNLYFNYHSPSKVAVGDIFICGAWVLSNTTNGFSGSLINPLTCAPTDTMSLTTTLVGSDNAINQGDGEWEWVWRIFKISSITGVTPTMTFGVAADPTHTITAYNPVLIRIPSGSVSDNEAFNIASYLRGYLNTCKPGQLCDTVGQVPHVNAQQTWSAAQSFGTISINNEPFSAAPRSEQNIFLPGPLTSTWTASTWTPDKTVTLTRVQVQAKTPPAGCSTNAVVEISDGTHAVKLAISSAANDSGAVSQNYAAGVPLTISLQTAASGCSSNPADANVTLQYKMQ